MARTASGAEALEKAKQCLAEARTVGELRQAQAVILPLEFGFSMDQVAAVIGVSRGWACRLRTRFIQEGRPAQKKQRGGRRRQNISRQEEAEFLAPFFDQAAKGGILVVAQVKKALDERLGRQTALASVYNLLHRHGWRKLAPDKRRPQPDMTVQQEWKNNSCN